MERSIEERRGGLKEVINGNLIRKWSEGELYVKPYKSAVKKLVKFERRVDRGCRGLEISCENQFIFTGAEKNGSIKAASFSGHAL